MAEFEENLKRDDDEIRELRAKLRNYEDMAEEYQTQAKRANQVRLEYHSRICYASFVGRFGIIQSVYQPIC